MGFISAIIAKLIWFILKLIWDTRSVPVIAGGLVLVTLLATLILKIQIWLDIGIWGYVVAVLIFALPCLLLSLRNQQAGQT